MEHVQPKGESRRGSPRTLWLKAPLAERLVQAQKRYELNLSAIFAKALAHTLDKLDAERRRPKKKKRRRRIPAEV